MPPNFKFTRTEILTAACDLTREHGISAVTARAVAERLGASPKVIFSFYPSMEALRTDVFAAARARYRAYVERGLACARPFRGVGEQYIRFAIDEPKLFQLLFMREQEQIPTLAGVLPQIDDSYEKILASICVDTRVDPASAERLYRHLWIYTHGIASLCATGMCRFTAEEIGVMMAEVYLGLLSRLKEENP